MRYKSKTDVPTSRSLSPSHPIKKLSQILGGFRTNVPSKPLQGDLTHTIPKTDPHAKIPQA